MGRATWASGVACRSQSDPEPSRQVITAVAAAGEVWWQAGAPSTEPLLLKSQLLEASGPTPSPPGSGARLVLLRPGLGQPQEL